MESLIHFGKRHKIFTAMSLRKHGPMGKITDLQTSGIQRLRRFLWGYDISHYRVVVPKEMQTANVCAVTYREGGSIVSFDGKKSESGVDGLITSDCGLFLTTYARDCLVLLGVDLKRGVIFNAHAGWLGLKNRLPTALVSSLLNYGSSLADIHLWIGPTVHWQCYEFLRKDAEKLFPGYGEFVKPHESDEEKIFLDLRGICIRQLLTAGLPMGNISYSTCCTMHNQKLFSHRGGDGSGYNMAFVVGRP